MPRYTTDDDTRSALPAYVCIADAKAKSEYSERLYSNEYKAYGEFIKGRVEASYFRSSVYLDYREKFISITVHKPTRHDLVSSVVFHLDDYCETRNIRRVVTSKGNIVYRIPLDELPNLVG